MHIKHINSINDKIIAETAKLKADKKYRYASGLFVVEGIRMVSDAIASNAKIKGVFLDKTRTEYLPVIKDVDYYTTEQYILSKICSTVTPQGIAAVVEMQATRLSAPTGNTVVLDSIQDPGNAGSIMRTALAAGITDIYFVASVDPYNPKTVKSSMSAIFHQNIYIAHSAGEVLPLLKGAEVICADMEGVSLFDITRPNKFALVIGNEGAGISKEFLDAGRTVKIPMDSRVESLNAAASAAIMLYSLTRGDF